MERKLCSIMTVDEIHPIDGKDRIVLARVGGWQCIVQKTDFVVGDKCVYAENDSIFPNKPEYAFLEKRGFRIKPMKFGGVLSQGLALPLTNYPDFKDMEIGTDVTSLLEVIKYDVPDTDTNEPSKGSFPTYLGLSITDEIRYQAVYDIREELHGKTCVITTKLDGSSITHFINNGDFGVCSRKLQKTEVPDSKWWKLTYKYDLANRMKELGKNLGTQSEAVGPSFKGSGKHGNASGLSENDMFVFNVYDIDEHKYLDYDRACEWITKLGLKKVPVITDSFVFDMNKHTPEYFYSMMENMKYEGTDTPIEGIVVRPVQYFYSKALKGLASIKVLNPLFDLKSDK